MIGRLSITFVLTIFTSQLCFSQGWLAQGARSAGLGHSSVTLIDVFAFHHNPGALGFMDHGSAAISYENRFLMRELQSQSFAVVQPIDKGVLSFGGQFYGYDSFRTNRFGGGYSMFLSEKLAAGVQINYLNLRLDPFYGVKHSVTGEIGLLTLLGEETFIGASVVNLGRARLSEFKDDRLSTIIRLGASHQLTDELLVMAELEQEVTYTARLRTGIEYQPLDIFYIRGGVQGNPMNFSLGMGFRFNNIMLEVATQYDQILGLTPVVSLLVDFNQRTTNE